MDFSKLQNTAQGIKKQAQKLRDQARNQSDKALSYATTKLVNSQFMLRDIAMLEDFVETSKNTKFTNSKTQEEKVFVKQVIIIFADPGSDFFKDLLYLLPVLSAKAFSQNIALKFADGNMNGLDKKLYKITMLPSLVLVENKKVTTVVAGEEKIQKVVKSLDLDINGVIESLEK